MKLHGNLGLTNGPLPPPSAFTRAGAWRVQHLTHTRSVCVMLTACASQLFALRWVKSDANFRGNKVERSGFLGKNRSPGVHMGTWPWYCNSVYEARVFFGRSNSYYVAAHGTIKQVDDQSY